MESRPPGRGRVIKIRFPEPKEHFMNQQRALVEPIEAQTEVIRLWRMSTASHGGQEGALVAPILCMMERN